MANAQDDPLRLLASHFHTPRTLLRRPLRTDMRSWCALIRSPKVRRYMNGPVLRRAADEWNNMQLRLGEAPLIVCAFTIAASSSSELVGQCGFFRFAGNTQANELELWCVLRGNYAHKGFGSEVVTALLSEAFAKTRVERIVGIVHPENLRSRTLVSRLGFRHTGNYDADDWKNGHLVFSLYRSDFETG
jgi:[ribosomal protein S5]-alanine N-acetyltransferase